MDLARYQSVSSTTNLVTMFLDKATATCNHSFLAICFRLTWKNRQNGTELFKWHI